MFSYENFALAKPHCKLSTVVLTSTIAAVSEAVKKVIDNNKEPGDKECSWTWSTCLSAIFVMQACGRGRAVQALTYHKGKLILEGADHIHKEGADHTHKGGADHTHKGGADHTHKGGTDHTHKEGADHTHKEGADHTHKGGKR